MRLRPDQLGTHLDGPLKPIYLISGDEPLQHGETADRIRAAARRQDYSEREVLEGGPSFDWNNLAGCADAMSLFAERRLIELRLPSPKIGTEGSRALLAYCDKLADSNLLLVLCPKLDRAQQNSKWFKALDRAGAIIQVWPIEGKQLLSWLEQRLRSRGLAPQAEVVPMLAQRIEGNLLAAAQEVDKLLLLNGPGEVSAEQLAIAVSDSTRFDVFSLVDAALSGNGRRAARILDGLQAEGTPASVALWALAREIRSLARMSLEIEQGTPAERVMSGFRIWDKRKPLVRQGLKRLPPERWQTLLCDCAQADRAVKGRSNADPWRLMQGIALGMAGIHLL